MEKEKSNDKLRLTLLTSLLLLLLSFGVLIGSSYSLWNLNQNVGIHLIAGNLNLKLERTKLTKKYLDTSTGLLKKGENTKTMDFTNSSSNIFDIADGEMVVPGCYYEATLKLTNSGSVAFDYSINFNVNDNVPSNLAKQMKISFNGTSKGYLADDKNKTFEIAKGSMNIKQSSDEFTIKVEFENLSNNNSAMNSTVYFDLSINATQKTE